MGSISPASVAACFALGGQKWKNDSVSESPSSKKNQTSNFSIFTGNQGTNSTNTQKYQNLIGICGWKPEKVNVFWRYQSM